ncbi:ferredoxin [Microlunatus speluncae]|uniref:ferredoxin n=1 Tax=Microlunatus speluncae TaxID=2594267 RepID=UPI0012665DD1|nr:ferredoxin [Microlunatus speluncae]
MKIITDRDKCVGGGQCVVAAPDVFDQDDDGLVELLAPEPEPALQEAARDAARLCPARAIDLADG